MDTKQYIKSVVESTREHIFIRDEDGILIIKPNRVHNLNPMATKLLKRLYELPAEQAHVAIEEISKEFGVPEERVYEDARKVLDTLLDLLKHPFSVSNSVKMMPFGSHKRDLPVLSEIALTYGCNNNCVFCYASSPERESDVEQMTTEQVKRILDIIRNDAKIPTVSFTVENPHSEKTYQSLSDMQSQST